jgi:hypothetical protein
MEKRLRFVDEERSHFLVAMDREGLGIEIGK